MFRLVSALLALPWPVMALIAAGLFWAAQDTHRRVTAYEAEKAQALQAGAPAPVALDQFAAADVHLAEEVHVAAWINTEHNYELTKQRKGTDTVRRMFVLFGPGDAADSRVARGIVLLRPDEVDGFVTQLMGRITDPLDPRLPFHLNGRVDPSPELSDMVRDAFEERGLLRAAEFVVIEPYLDGREAALAADPEAPMRGAVIFGGLGGLAALAALGRALGGRARQKRRAALARADLDRAVLMAAAVPAPGAVAAATRPVAATPLGPTGAGYTILETPKAVAWSPLEAVMARQEGRAGAERGGASRDAALMVGGQEKKGRAVPVWRALPLRKLMLAVVLYAVMAALMGGMGGSLLGTQMAGAPMGGLLEEMKATLGPVQTERVEPRVPTGAWERSGPVVVPIGAAPGRPAADAPQMAVAEVVPDWMDRLSPDVFRAEMTGLLKTSAAIAGGMVVMLLSSLLLARHRRQRVAGPGRDPWDRLSERLR